MQDDRASNFQQRIFTQSGNISTLQRYVRFFALDTMLVIATAERGPAVAKAIELILDPDDAVRWKALNFLAWAGSDELAAGAEHLRDARLRERARWLAGSPPSHSV